MKGRLAFFLAVIIVVICIIPAAFAGTEKTYYLNKKNSTIYTGHDNGFSEVHSMDRNNPHYGWDMGYFYLKGYTDMVYDDQDGSIVFLKNAEDELHLCFDLNPSIKNLDEIKATDGSSWRVNFDSNGYDKYFQTKPGAKEKDQAGKGYLVIMETNSQNSSHEPVIYNNYLESVKKGTAETRVKALAEGDYEVALDYELAFNGLNINAYNDYRIFVKFKVRNSNCMVYLYDNETGEEITNGASINEKGFCIDYKNSHYLTVNVKELKLAEHSGVYSLDERLDRKAHDGKIYTDEALYIITVENKYTKAKSTPKYISVGNNKMLNIYAAYTGSLDINDISKYLDEGVQVDTNWLLLIPNANADELESNSRETDYSGFRTSSSIEAAGNNNTWMIIACVACAVAIGALVAVLIVRKKEIKQTDKED